MKYDKKTALITGASSGIGKELAKIHASKGDNLILVARRKENLNNLKLELENKYKINAIVIDKDLSKINSAKEVYDEVKSLNISIDYLINNAGFGQLGKFDELPLNKHLEMMHLNMISLTELTYYFLQDMLKKGEGKILNVSSLASYLPGPLQAVYFATKAYVSSFSNALFEELRNTNITVTNLMPGATLTEFDKASGTDKTDLFKNAVSPVVVALDGYNGMIKGELDVISGITCSQKLMIKMIPFTPKKVLLTNVRKMQEI